MWHEWSTLEKLIWLKRRIGGGASWVWRTITGSAPLTLANAVHHAIQSLTQYGLCTQAGIPTPDAPVDIMTNNGAIKLRRPSGMPIAYQMVEWLKSTGTIVITGFKTKSTQEIETVFYRESRGSSYLYSSDTLTSGTTNTTAYLTTAGGNWRWDGKVATINPAAGVKITSIQNKDGVWINGTQYGYYTDPGDFVSTNDLRLSSNENTTVRIYSMTIREGETVTLDLVPVQRVTDNAYGFYDKVSGNFYTNANATFEAGDPIDDPVEIYTDGTDEVLTVSGKNLFDENTVTLGYYYSDTGAYSQNSTSFVSAKIPIGAGVTVTFSRADVKRGVYMRISAFDSSDNWLALVGKSETTSSLTVTGTTPTNTAYIRVSASKSVSDVIDADCQVEIGSTASEYVPYVASQTVTVPMLLSVDTVKDEWEAVHGPLTHRIGIYVIKGSDDEGWAENTSYLRTFYADCLPVAALITTFSMFTRYEGVLGSRSVGSMLNGTAKCGSSSNRQRIFIRDVSCADVDALKAKLSGFYAAGEPCIVAFALATETTEQGTAHELHTTAGDNIVDVTANVSPVELKVEYASNN